MAKYRILVTDGVSPRGVEVLSGSQEFEVVEVKSMKEPELLAKLPEFDALIVRSQTKVSGAVIKACKRLKVIGRAGVGVDNVDVDAATAQGVVVMNTPGGNTISTAEHSFAMLLSVARQIPQAHASMKEGKWDRKTFQGTEINNKVLGIIGMGRIGSEVARRAFAFGMRVLAYDPYLSLARARSLQVELFSNLEELLPQCDFITVHMPMTDETKGLLDEKKLALCKKGVRIINCARGGLVVEAALQKAMESGHVAGAAFDVYEQEPPAEDFGLRKLPNMVMTPHLAASTFEAQESVGVEIAEAIRDLLLTGTIRNAVNMPSVDSKTLETLRPYLNFGTSLGKMLSQIAPAHCDTLTVTYRGKMSEMDTTSITRAVLKGFLHNAEGGSVNEVNVPKVAEGMGLKFNQIKQSEVADYSDLVEVKASSGSESAEVAGAFFGTNPRIVRINGYSLEAAPEGVLLMFENKDRPGIVGWIGTLLGKNSVNIAHMALSRSKETAKALSVLNLDSLPSASALEEIRKGQDIFNVRTVQL